MSKAVMLEGCAEAVDAADVSSAVMLEAGAPVCLAIPEADTGRAPRGRHRTAVTVADEAVEDPYVAADAAVAEDDTERRKAMLRWRLRKMIEAEGLTIREVLYLR